MTYRALLCLLTSSLILITIGCGGGSKKPEPKKGPGQTASLPESSQSSDEKKTEASEFQRAFQSGRPEVMRRVAEQQLLKFPKNSEALYLLALADLKEGKYSLALGHLNLLDGKVKGADYHYNRGLSLYRLDQKKAALEELRQAVRENSRHQPTRELMAQLFYEAADYRKTVTTLKPVIGNVDSAAMFYLYGQSLVGVGEVDEADRFFEKAVQTDRDNAILMMGYAEYLAYWKKDAQKAQGLLDQLSVLGVDASLRGRYSKVQKLVQKVVQNADKQSTKK